MLNEYFCKEDLEQISIKEYLGTDKSITELVNDIDSDFVLDNADVFKQGVCQLFAYALNQKFNYPVFIITVDERFHIFCKLEDGKYYIDVRGITLDFEKFIKGTEVPYMPVDISVPYSFVEEDFNGEYHYTGLLFAKAVIYEDEERYRL
ncbi:hypothetical protein IMK14_00255 [Sneathia sp. DSM 16630]|nr:hypothetical protein [Sneathia sp. DSM 16630]